MKQRRQIACVRPINWAIERVRRKLRRTSSTAPEALVLVQTTANRQIVVWMCERARERGVRVGLSLAEARALCPRMVHVEHDPGKDAKGLEALGRWMMRFSPCVQCGEGGLFLDVTGTERLFGSLEELVCEIGRALEGLRIPARLAIAPTSGAAWALTYAGEANAIARGNLEKALAPLPAVALRIEEETLTTLHHLGLQTVGQVLALPRKLLPARFGANLLLRIDQALGRMAEPLVPLAWETAIEARVDFDGVVDSLEVLWEAFKELIGQVCAELVRRGAGARRLKVVFLRPYAASVEKQVELSRASRNPSVIFNLVRCAMEAMGEGTKARRHGGTKGKTAKHVFTLRRSVAPSLRRYEIYQPAGFTGLRLSVPVFERLTEEQIFLLEQEEQVGRAELDRLIERLRIRLGEGGLVGVAGVECYVPEKAFRVQGSGLGVQESEREVLVHRPLHLFSKPTEIAVMVRPSHDRDGAPVSFVLEGEGHRIVHAVGPERIGGAWWTGHDKTRDYFDVEDEAGRRWWVFRVFQTSRWFLQGIFE